MKTNIKTIIIILCLVCGLFSYRLFAKYDDVKPFIESTVIYNKDNIKVNTVNFYR